MSSIYKQIMLSNNLDEYKAFRQEIDNWEKNYRNSPSYQEITKLINSRPGIDLYIDRKIHSILIDIIFLVLVVLFLKSIIS